MFSSSSSPLLQPFSSQLSFLPSKPHAQSVVATTRWNGTHSLLTSAKLLVGYLVVGIYKRT